MNRLLPSTTTEAPVWWVLGLWFGLVYGVVALFFYRVRNKRR